MSNNLLLWTALAITAAIAIWGVVDTAGLTSLSASMIHTQFTSRAWFIMLTVSFILVVVTVLTFSKYGSIKLGSDDDEPEFSTVSWLSMLFAAGMGVGLLYWATAEPITHFLVISKLQEPQQAAGSAMFVTLFHWGLHAWAIYALTGLVLAYFGFRLGCRQLVSAPITKVFGRNRITISVGWVVDLLAIVAIAIGLGGSIAMGVFQIEEGIQELFGFTGGGIWVSLIVLAVLIACYIPPLLVDLSSGMATLSNTAMILAGFLLIFVLLVGPTHFVMGGITESLGSYFGGVFVHGFRTYTFMDDAASNWFQNWTLSYMVWWLAWAPFVGVFIARISKGRTIREFLLGVILVPTMFSILWFGVFGSIGFYAALRSDLPILDVVQNNISSTTFFVLKQFPFAKLTMLVTVVAAFLFVITSVVSAAFVLGMFSSNGELNPSSGIKLSWGLVLGALGLVMILSDSIDAVKSLIALGALPFVFVVLVLAVCLLKALKLEAVNKDV